MSSTTSISDRLAKNILAEYQPGVSGRGARPVAALFGVGRQTVLDLYHRSQIRGTTSPLPRGGSKRKLTPAQEERVVRLARRNATATNRALAAAVGDKVAPRTISDVLARTEPPFTRKKITDLEPEERTEEWQAACRQFVGRVKRIPLDTRIYADEAGIFTNERKRRGRAPRGQPALRFASRHGKKYTLHVYARHRSVLHWELADVNARDAEVRRVALKVAKKMKLGDVLIWDRLGKSGRSANPRSQHYNPDVLAAVAARGARVLHLPPKGKYLNPVELLLNDLKEHHVRPAFPVSGANMTKLQLTTIITQFMQKVAPKNLPGYYRARANGRDMPNFSILEE